MNMTLEEFKDFVKTGRPLDTEEIHQFMDRMGGEARKITFRLNAAYHTPEEIRDILSGLFGKTVLSLGRPEAQGENGSARTCLKKSNGSYLRIFTDGQKCTGLIFLGPPNEAASAVSVFGRAVSTESAAPVEGFQ